MKISLSLPKGSEPAFPDEAPPTAYSFDLFDTCVSRSHAYPRDLFFDLGLRLAPKPMDRQQAARFAREFQASRIRAERRAMRLAQPHECATIHEIYAHLSPPRGLALDREALVAAEFELERESIYPVTPVIERIRSLRAAGHRIIFISDMYLPGDMLRPLLQDLGVLEPDDALYVSCDVRLTKHTGNLYRHVLMNEGLVPSQVMHTGDNLWSDVRVASSHGLRCQHFGTTALSLPESIMAGRKRGRLGIRSSIAALSRRSRLFFSTPTVAHGEADAVIHGVIAPFLVAYVGWVLEHASRSGVGRLYFVARDGEVLYKIAQKLRAPGHPELRYLHGSRRAWLAPSIRDDARGWERFLITPGQSNSGKDILSRAGLGPTEQASICLHLGYSSKMLEEPLSREEAQHFLAEVLVHPETSNILYAFAAERRAVALQYLRQQGLVDGTPWALVDAGWALNSQAALRRILLDEHRISGTVRGYYIALTRDHLSESEAGESRAFISPPGSIFSRRRVVVEHCFTPSTHATTRSYAQEQAEALPVFGPEVRETSELAYAQRLHAACEYMASALAGLPSGAEILTEGRSHIVAGAERLLRRPSAAEARAFANFGTVADLRHEKQFVEPLCRRLGFRDLLSILGMTVSRGRNFRSPSFMWLEGSASLSPAYLRLAVKAMLLVDQLKNSAPRRK